MHAGSRCIWIHAQTPLARTYVSEKAGVRRYALYSSSTSFFRRYQYFFEIIFIRALTSEQQHKKDYDPTVDFAVGDNRQKIQMHAELLIQQDTVP